MPTYDYQCYQCNATREEQHPMSDEAIRLCHICEEPMSKVILSAPLMRMAGTVAGKWVGDSSVYTKQLKKKKKEYFIKK
jgi:putative FmdB family regulatory protein